MSKIKVLICDDHAIVREVLQLLLEGAEDIEVVGEAENGLRAVAETQRLMPDVVLMDMSMPILGGVEAARQIASLVPAAKVLILSAHDAPPQRQQALEAGAAGYLTKGMSSGDLRDTIRHLASGRASSNPRRDRGKFNPQAKRSPKPGPTSISPTALTQRQLKVLELIAEGYGSKRIAKTLSISVKTVEKHRQDIMNRLNLRCVATLTRYAVSIGIIDCNLPPPVDGHANEAPVAGGHPTPSTAQLNSPVPPAP